MVRLVNSTAPIPVTEQAMALARQEGTETRGMATLVTEILVTVILDMAALEPTANSNMAPINTVNPEQAVLLRDMDRKAASHPSAHTKRNN
jgi:hypothetical protein